MPVTCISVTLVGIQALWQPRAWQWGGIRVSTINVDTCPTVNRPHVGSVRLDRCTNWSSDVRNLVYDLRLAL